MRIRARVGHDSLRNPVGLDLPNTKITVHNIYSPGLGTYHALRSLWDQGIRGGELDGTKRG